ncbi:MAG: zf-HC2 domain-containing protein, partial [Chloroflexia bacterium]
MNCTRYRQLISRYVDDEVTPRQRRELLAHVEVCHDCASWLARARQTDVLLKPLSTTSPSDSVRNAILTQLRNDGGLKKAELQQQSTPTPAPSTQHSRTKNAILSTKKHRSRPFHTFFSSLLLRFDPSPRRIAFGSFVAICASLGILFYLNILPQFWSNKLGFEVQPDSAGVGSTPISIPAISSDKNGSDASNAPRLVLAQPGDGSQV